MGKKNLFDEDSGEEEKLELKTNENYAKLYNQFRKKELLSHLKYQDLDEESSSSDDISTDEEVVNPEFDKEFFRTLAFLKSRNPKKYAEKKKFFDKTKTVEEYIKEKQKKKEKPITIKDYKRELLLKHGPDFEEEDDICEEEKMRLGSPTMAEEQEKLRQELKNALNTLDDDSYVNAEDEGIGGMLHKRDKTLDELEKEEEDHLSWLAGRKEVTDEEAKSELKPLKEFWNSKELTKDDMFLRDYILNKRYVENESIPTYDEIVGTLSDDEEELKKQEEFEHKYNYRFEDPDKEFLKRFPRTIHDSVRAVDNKRKEKRKERQERKEQQKLMKKKELDEFNKLRKHEIEEKIQRLKEIAQNENFNLKEDDLESDFDPEEHDKRMREAFNDEYYMINEGEQKPEFPEIDKEFGIEDWDNFNAEKDEENPTNIDTDDNKSDLHCEDDDFNMDCDYNPIQAKLDKSKVLQEELIESTKSKRKKKKRTSKLAEIIKMEKPSYDPDEEKTFEEYLDEYYKLDYEDIIGDTPCRFKYVETTPNDFGLTIEEILMASNKELNQWASLKKTMQIRPKQADVSDYHKYRKRAQNLELKKKILKSIYGEQEDGKLDENIQQIVDPVIEKPPVEVVDLVLKKKKKKEKRKKQVNQTSANQKLQDKNCDQVNEKSVEQCYVQKANPGIETKEKSKKLLKRKSAHSNLDKVNILKQHDPPVKKKIIAIKKPSEKNHPKFNKNSKVSKHNMNKNTNKLNPKRKLHKPDNNQVSNLSENRLRAFGINPKRFYNKLKYGPNSLNKTTGIVVKQKRLKKKEK